MTLFLLALALSLAAGPQPAETPATVGPEGLLREGRIGLDDPKVTINAAKDKTFRLSARSFSVRLKAGQRYCISLKGQEIDAVLMVQDEQGRQLAWDDNSGGGLDALVTLDVMREKTFTVYA